MGRFYECSECEHAQVVGVIDNGLSGFADPHVRCENCGAVGRFHFGPGAARSLRDSIANAVRVSPPDPSAFERLMDDCGGFAYRPVDSAVPVPAHERQTEEVTFRVSPRLREALERLAESEETSVTEIVREALATRWGLR